MADETVSGDIRFSRYWRAPLEAGEYKVVVQQTVTELHGGPVAAARSRLSIMTSSSVVRDLR